MTYYLIFMRDIDNDDITMLKVALKGTNEALATASNDREGIMLNERTTFGIPKYARFEID